MDAASETKDKNMDLHIGADKHSGGNEESTVAGNEANEMPSISWEAIAASDFQTGSYSTR